MSLRTIHADSSTNTDSLFFSKPHPIKQNLVSSPKEHEKNEESYTARRTITSIIVSVLTTIPTVILWCLCTVYQTTNLTMIYFAKKFHHLVNRVMRLDKWLIRKSARAEKRIRVVAVLCLLPLLFFAAWFLLTFLGSTYWSQLNPFEPVSPPIDLPKTIVDQEHPVETPTTSTLDTNMNNIVWLNTGEIIEKVLQDPKIYNILDNYYDEIESGKESDKKLLQITNELRNEITKIKNDLRVYFDRMLSQIRIENVQHLTRLTQKLNRCCNKHMIDLEPYVTRVFTSLLNNPDFLANQKGLTDWLHSLFVAKQHLEGRLSNLTENLSQNLHVSMETTANRVMDKVVTTFSEHPMDFGLITDQQIKKVVQSALKTYDADKTGLVDYAMESLGGKIVTTRHTKSYHSATISVMGVPVWYPTISPRVVISPGVNPGECWAFQDFPGVLVIKLAARVKIEAVSIEHVSRLVVPGGEIKSAPKEFEVYGLEKEDDEDVVKIGEYVYDCDGDSIQFFTAEQHKSFSMVEVRIKSNHGHPDYTCLYRFRVHGTVSNELASH